MKTRETALILGAGSSKVFGLPLGIELRDQISRDLEIKFNNMGHALDSGSYEIVEALRILARPENGGTGSINPHRAAAIEISTAMAFSSSIDDYVERHSDDKLKQECAKLAISKAILEAERKSNIFINPRSDVDGLLNTSSTSWLAYMLRDVTRGFNKETVSQAFDFLTIVNFNYDRCFEHFTFHWLQKIYRMAPQEAAEIVAGIDVYHPYGRLAPLPFENSTEHIPFGGEVNARRLLQMASRIRTYSEAKEADSGLARVILRLEEVRTLVFMGFGFHQQNLDLISLDVSEKRGSMNCYATTSSISNPRWEVYKDRIANAFAIPAHRDLRASGFDGYCEEFWEEYSDAMVV